MRPRVARAPLTAAAELEAARDQVASAIETLLRALLRESGGVAEYYDQTTSPLGHKRHCRLAREGKIPARKEGRRWLVKRADLEAYLERTVQQSPDLEDSVEAMIERLAG